MAENKEVYDYLRNRQKAAEIEAKVNGINLWVLLGAISIVTWQLLGSVGDILGQSELALRALLCADALYLFSTLGGGRRLRGEVRYSRLDLAEVESPFLMLLLGTLLLLPPTALALVAGMSWSSVICGFFGLAWVVFGVAAIVYRLLNLEANSEKFPKPAFGPTARSSVLFDLLSGIALSITLVAQGSLAWEHREVFTSDLAKQLILVAALYLLVVTAVQRRLQSDGIAWTYELETELLLGTVSAEIAVRRIEHRGLGPRLQDVMDRFFDDLDQRIGQLDLLFDQCRSKLESVREVPKEYGTERAARIQEATNALSAHVEGLANDSDEFGRYLKKLEARNIGARKAILSLHLASLRSRYEIYAGRIRGAKARLRGLTENRGLSGLA